MVELMVNGLPVQVEGGATVLDAAEAVSVAVPTLCHMKDCEPETSCMLCVVKNVKTGQLLPSCSAKAVEGMEVDTECEEVQAARREILNLLLSEHVGDCEAPCTRICPAHLDIPLMLREIERGNMESAAWIARRDLVIPATLGHVCPAPCEKGCRRGQLDEALKIRESHKQGSVRYFDEKHQNIGLTPNGRKAAVVGSGAAGLASAWKLRQLGYACTVYDGAAHAGGELRKHPDLPLDVLDGEIEFLRQSGIEFKLGEPLALHEIGAGYDGVVFASQEYSATHFSDAVYAEEHKLTVKAVANGKAAAVALDQLLKGEAPAKGLFDSRVGKLRESELKELEKNCGSAGGRRDACGTEAARCLHCDCRKPVGCKLRMYAEQYGADQKGFPADERAHVQLVGHNESVVFEPGKCIKCGLCIKVTKRAGEELGLAFVGRGFNTQVTVPFGEALQAGLKKTADEVVKICPTGALAFRHADENLDGITG